jgi:hypothetical protein
MPAFKTATGAALLLAMIATGAAAQAPAPETWPAVKCARYKEGYRVAITRQGRQGLGAEFLAKHDAFLASDCAGEHDVCPRSKEELDLANTLVILGMNQGMASTFMPFACRK